MVYYYIWMRESKRKIFQSLLFFAGNDIYKNIDQYSDPSLSRVCNESAVKLLKSIGVTILLMIIPTIIYGCFPISATLFNDDFQLPIPVLLPFTDYTTTHGRILNILNNMFVMTLGMPANISAEMYMCLIKNTIWACTVVIGHSIDEISVLLESSAPNKRQIIGKFRNILVQAQDLDR